MSITLGTYNILNPAYAVKYQTPQGITPEVQVFFGMAESDHLLCATKSVGLQPQRQAPT